MGRHSAPDDDSDLLVVDPPAPDRPLPRARHAAPDGTLVRTDVIEPEIVERSADAPPRDVVDAVVVEDEFHAARVARRDAPPKPTPSPAAPVEPAVEPAVEPVVVVPTPAPARAQEAAKARRQRPSGADLHLLRTSSSLRARCLAAVLLPFILYTIAMVVISRVDVYLFWIWIPAILAGVLFGAQLDGAQRAAQAAQPDDAPPAEPSTTE